ncbi:MAG: thiamine phosphate synthase [Stappia sp.]|jgi:thiamine-phosphate pyrophosphorylase|uniref:thiamine phosphate synthase n=1 Tax=Stappia sp. TaxID=1870903 RepID=UPI000C56DF65|nr:thiamine phosphate synthase [Stappia sp.]MAA96946.1 thiamine phosphate synthase [Stappia sp.]MBM19937.1 thiamine phosphate synthase [Stappia sp.]
MSAFPLDPFYPIVDSADWVERLVPLGVRLIQLRVKEMDGAGLRDEIARAERFSKAHDCLLVVNDHWRQAIDLGCRFVHLGQEDLAEADVGAIREAGLGLGLSSHDHEELDTAIAARPDYIALGPVYPTILKKMKWAPQGLERIGEWKRLIGDIPLVAIGGMSVERAPGAFDHGADIVSVVTDITLNTDPETRTRDWIAVTRGRGADRGNSAQS